MTYYRTVGLVPRKRHTVHTESLEQPSPRLHEELMGAAGFSGPSSLLYHRHSPSALIEVSDADDQGLAREPLSASHPLTPLHLRTPDLGDGADHDLVRHRHVLAGNSDLTIAVAHGSAGSPLYRSVVGDELVFLERGRATFESVFGAIEVGPGDYLVIPAGTTHRWVIHDPFRALIVESAGRVELPHRYLSANGQFLEQAPFCERDLRAPLEPLLTDNVGPGSGHSVLVRNEMGLSEHLNATHPFDVVGWDGSLYPYALAISDFEPIVGSLHQPPPVHQTFSGNGFVVCSFVPRPFDFHPDAVKIPYHHSNVDSDEVLYYVGGDFMSRAGSGIGQGSISLHPAGFIHGPQPGSYEASVPAKETAETAVMIDTFKPLLITETARRIADPDYLRSWLA